MSQIEKVSVALTTELADRVRDAVRSGDYASASEVVRDALREWAHDRDARARIARLWDEGLASGVAEHRRTAAEIGAAGRRRLASRQKAR
jgi:antitoxin ParD1/3/4